MTQKVFISSQDTSEFVCSACNRHYVKDMSPYLNIPKTTKLKIKCTCGYTWDAMLEKRRFYRKRVRLRGTYKYQITGKTVSEGFMTVLDISRTGVKLEIHGDHKLKDGDWIELEFQLDNQVQTLVNRMVNIKNVSGKYIGASFREVKHFDPVIGFYMLQHTPPQEKEEEEELEIKEIS